jgi:hypothetical protein
MLEVEIEDYLTEGVELLGGQCLKWVIPGRVGPPDRILLMPGGRIVFVELKTIGGKLEPWQKRFHLMLVELGFRVAVLWTPQQVSDFLLTL